MRQNMLKLSTLAILIAGVTNANAAVYKIVEVDETGSGLSAIDSINYYGKNTSGSTETYAQAIQQSNSTDDCFAGTCGDYKTVGESRFGPAGIEYRDDVAYTSDILQRINDVTTLESYCKENLGFNTCDKWAKSRYYGAGYNTEDERDESGYAGLLREQQAFRNGYTRNSFLLVDGQPQATFAEDSAKYANAGTLGAIQANSMNSVPNGITTINGVDYVYGVTSSAYFNEGSRYARTFAKRGFVQDGTSVSLELSPPSDGTKLAQAMGTTTAWKAIKNPTNDKMLVVGSASFNESHLDDSNKLPSSSQLHINGQDVALDKDKLKECSTQANDGKLADMYNTWECQFTVFANDAYLWTVDTAAQTATPVRIANRTLAPKDPDEDRRSYQASARSIENVNGKPVIVGYSTERVSNDYYAQRATVYTPKDGVDFSGTIPADSWTAKFIGPDIKDGDKRQFTCTMATDINQNNKVVGVAKLERSESRAYAERMFVYDNNNSQFKYLDSNVSGIFFDGSNGYASAINNKDVVVGKLDSETANQVDGRQRRQRGFLYNAGGPIAGSPLTAGGAWFLDDLTNNNDQQSNSYRIAEVSDINDAGVISATAMYCEGGYDNFSQGATCKNDSKDPNDSERVVAVKLVPIQNGDIQARPEEETQIKRNGASLGMFALTLLGFIGFRRRK